MKLEKILTAIEYKNEIIVIDCGLTFQMKKCLE